MTPQSRAWCRPRAQVHHHRPPRPQRETGPGPWYSPFSGRPLSWPPFSPLSSRFFWRPSLPAASVWACAQETVPRRRGPPLLPSSSSPPPRFSRWPFWPPCEHPTLRREGIHPHPSWTCPSKLASAQCTWGRSPFTDPSSTPTSSAIPRISERLIRPSICTSARSTNCSKSLKFTAPEPPNCTK